MAPVGLLAAMVLLSQLGRVCGDCWLIEGEKGYVWLAICSQNQPPYESIPQHINSTVLDLRLNENKLKVLLYSSLSRFGNLTDLNLTKNEISYVEDGAFLVQSNLRVLQLGYNKLTNLTENMFRGLTRLEYMYVQHNLIESISVNSFWECPNLISIDLSANKLAKVEGSTFTSLSGLMVCELAGNPFNCSCELVGFLNWLDEFNNVTRTYDRLQCESPPEYAGYPLLSPRPTSHHNAITLLASSCRNGVKIVPFSTPVASKDPETYSSGINPAEFSSTEPITAFTLDITNSPTIKLHHVTITGATLVVQIPSPYSRMYILVQYNNSYVSDVTNLRNRKEYIKLEKLKALTDYTFCVASIQKSQRFNHTCLTFATRGRMIAQTPNSSTTTHYIMTILGCLFGMVIVLGVVYYCLRKRRIREEKQKSINVKKTILEMRYGPESETSSMIHQMHKYQKQPVSVSRMSSLPSVSGEKGQFKPVDLNETPKATKGNYIEVRTAESLERKEDEAKQTDNEQGSTAEISTIAQEVDKVNQIINNCIDALKLDSAAFIGTDSEVSIDRQLTPSSSSTQLERPALLSPAYKDGGGYPLQRQSSADTARKRCSISSSSSGKSARVFSLDIPDLPSKAEAKYIEKSAAAPTSLRRLPSAAAAAAEIQHLEVQQSYHCSEHRHSVPALYYEEHGDSLSQRSTLLKPLSRSKRDSAYSQLSPRHHFSGYSSSPEYSSESTHKIWERFRPYRKHPREEIYLAAGHALRKKVQFAKDEDLHDILDYWKGVSAQQKM
ncbi:protein phosphatase 1 regulatory subunit 29 [Amblyraja radiata]|uniref:protein phosphatase 1 regulatory subunit 29 n=1 Tax=Amblyraja radiata TaxID=386614 RepID=UPI001403E9CD|nr:protein phosphatase 1 regulatory subunit 29 [Amblyraja radiata]